MCAGLDFAYAPADGVGAAHTWPCRVWLQGKSVARAGTATLTKRTLLQRWGASDVEDHGELRAQTLADTAQPAACRSCVRLQLRVARASALAVSRVRPKNCHVDPGPRHRQCCGGPFARPLPKRSAPFRSQCTGRQTSFGLARSRRLCAAWHSDAAIQTERCNADGAANSAGATGDIVASHLDHFHISGSTQRRRRLAAGCVLRASAGSDVCRVVLYAKRTRLHGLAMPCRL